MRLTRNNPTQYVDVLGLNEVILCGGCNSNARGLDHDAHPLLPEFIKALGDVIKMDMGGRHDRNWSNFITAAEKEIKRRKKVLKKGESIEWIVDYSSYSIRGINDDRGPDYYINIIKKKAKELDVILKFYNSDSELWDAINNLEETKFIQIKTKNHNYYNITYHKPRSGDAKISRFVYSGHGTPGNLMIRFIPHNDHIKPDPMLITTDDIKHGFIDKGIFMKGAIAISCGCNTATPTEDGTSSFTEVWKEYFGFAMAGARGRTDYKDIESSDPQGDTPQLGTNASWGNPSSPVPSPLSPLLD